MTTVPYQFGGRLCLVEQCSTHGRGSEIFEFALSEVEDGDRVSECLEGVSESLSSLLGFGKSGSVVLSGVCTGMCSMGDVVLLDLEHLLKGLSLQCTVALGYLLVESCRALHSIFQQF